MELDKRKSQTIGRLSSKEPKRWKSEPKKSVQDSANLAPATESTIALQANVNKPSLQSILNTYYKCK